MHIKHFFTILILLLLLPYMEMFAQTSPDDIVPLTSIEEGLTTPLRLAIDAQDNIYVTDVIQKCIKKYDANGNLVASLAQNAVPVSVAISPNGELFYGDGNTGHIYNLGGGGQQKVFYTGTEYPSSMAFSPDNILYVADNILKKVLAIDLSGTLVGTIGEGELVFPTGVAFDVKNDRILVAEHGGIGGDVMSMGWWGKGPFITVHMFDRQGNVLGSFGSAGNGNGKFYRLQGMTVGRCGYIYLCEPFQGNVSVFNEDGNFITKFAEYGNGPGQLNIPIDIAFDSQDRIIISCYNKGSLELFAIDDPLPSAKILTPYVSACQGSQGDISIQLTGTLPWSISYTYDDSDPVTIDNITTNPFVLAMTEPGEFQLTAVSDATASGTCISGSASVSFHPEPTATIRNNSYSICEGTFASIPVYFTGDGPWTFTYTHDGIDPVTIRTTHNPHLLEVANPGQYNLIYLSGANCDGSIINGTATVTTTPLPSATFTDGSGYFHMYRCFNDPPVDLEILFTGTAPWTFTYTVNDKFPTEIQTFSNPYLLSADQEGIYEILVVADNSCSSTNAYGYPDVIVRPEPTADIPMAELGLCPNTVNYFPIYFTGTAPWTFSVQRNGAPAVVTTTSDNPYMFPAGFIGTYTVTSLSDQYCTGNPTGVSVNVGHANPPSASVPAEEITLCEGYSADIPLTFTGTAPWTFTYEHNGTNPVTITTAENNYLLSVSEPGIFSFTALYDANCDARKLPANVTVVQYGMPVANYTYVANELELSFTNGSINASQYNWSFGDNNTSTEVNPVHVYAEPGDYLVSLEAISEYCGFEMYSEIISVFSLKDLSDENGTPSGAAMDKDGALNLNIYPNPSDGLFVLELSGACSDDIYIEVISMTAQVLYASKVDLPFDMQETGTITHQLNLGSFAQGVYQLRLRCGQQLISQLLAISGK